MEPVAGTELQTFTAREQLQRSEKVSEALGISYISELNVS